MKTDFEDYVTKARNGDADAFAELYSKVYKDLYYIALCNLKNSHDAADAVSDTVLDAYVSIKKLKDETAFKAWIFKILTVKIKRKQTEYIRNRENTTDLSDEMRDMIPEKNNRYSGVEIVEQFNSLNENEKLVFSLSVICGYSSDEISQITGIKSATVRSHLLRGREKLKKELSV